MIGKARSSGLIGKSDATPSRRKSIAALSPTTKPRPIVCASRMPGYAQSDPELRTHVQNAVFSIDARNCIGRIILPMRELLSYLLPGSERQEDSYAIFS